MTSGFPVLDISKVAPEEKTKILLSHGFILSPEQKDGAWRLVYKPQFQHPLIVRIDESREIFVNLSEKEIVF